jgi:hypothetical protein
MNRLPDGASRVNRPAPKSVNSEAGFCELTGASQPQVSMACVDDVSGQVSVMSSTPQLVAAYVQGRTGSKPDINRLTKLLAPSRMTRLRHQLGFRVAVAKRVSAPINVLI